MSLDFWSKTTPEPNTGCWLWTASVNWRGYGKTKFRNVQSNAHRVAWILSRGDIAAGLVVCHSCDEPSCVNPAHLFLGTQGDNMRDMVAKKRKAVRRGERNCFAKLTREQVEFARSSPLKQGAVAKMLGVSASAISLIRSGKTWAADVD